MNQYGGFISSSHVSSIIKELSDKYGETPEIKLSVNNSITNSGHGSIFLGTSASYEGGDRNIRILIGAHFARSVPLKIGIFGGKCDRGEMTLDTVIRETIEEIFNFKTNPLMIKEIRNFLNQNTQLYFIFQASQSHKAYSYIFDVSILGDFIRIISQIGRTINTTYSIPINRGVNNIEQYYIPNIEFTDLSSFNGNPYTGINSTIRLSDFLRDRYVFSEQLASHQSGLNEIKYLSFASLGKIAVAARTTGVYDIYNFVNGRRETLQFQNFFKKILTTDIIDDILRYSI